MKNNISKTKIMKQVFSDVSKHFGYKQFDYVVLKTISKSKGITTNEVSKMFRNTLEKHIKNETIERKDVKYSAYDSFNDSELHARLSMTKEGSRIYNIFVARFETLYYIAHGSDLFPNII